MNITRLQIPRKTVGRTINRARSASFWGRLPHQKPSRSPSEIAFPRLPCEHVLPGAPFCQIFVYIMLVFFCIMAVLFVSFPFFARHFGYFLDFFENLLPTQVGKHDFERFAPPTACHQARCSVTSTRMPIIN